MAENSEAQKRERQVVAHIELREALADNRQLRGLIPMCSHCRKVRDDTGFWDRVEHYIMQHTDATVSHGICPACFEKHYPEEFARLHPPDPGDP